MRSFGSRAGQAPRERSPEENERAALRTALNILDARDVPAARLRQKLRERGYDRDITDRVIEALRLKGYLQEERMAEAAVRYLLETKLLGHARILMELRERGFSPDTIDGIDFDSPPYSELDWEEAKRKLYRRMGSEDSQKTYAAFLRHGWNLTDYKAAVRAAEEEEEE